MKVLFLWMKGNTHPWLGAGPPIVVHRVGLRAGRTVFEAGLGTGEGFSTVDLTVELSGDTGTN